MDKSPILPTSSTSTREQQNDGKSVKMCKQAIKEKLEYIEKNRNIRLKTAQRKSLNKHSTPTKLYKSSCKRSCYEQLFSSSGTEKNLRLSSSDDSESLSELKSDYSPVRLIDMDKCIPNNKESSPSSSSPEKKAPSLTSGEESESSKALDRDLTLYTLSNDHCYSGSDSKTNDSNSFIKHEPSDGASVNAEKRFEIDTDASGCAEIIISHSKRYDKCLSEDSSVDQYSSSPSSKRINIKTDLELPSTPESQNLEPSISSLQAACSLLDERFRDMIVFGELISLKIKQLKSQRRNRTNINDAVKMFQKLFRFNSKCEKNFRRFNHNLIRNIKTLKDDYDIPVEISDDSSQPIPQNFKHLIKDCSVCVERAELKYPKFFNKVESETGCDIPTETLDSDKEIANLTNLSNLKRKRGNSFSDVSLKSSPKKSKLTSKSDEELYSSDSTHVSTVSMANSPVNSNENLSINELAKKQILENSMSDSTDIESDETIVEKTSETGEILKDDNAKTLEQSENSNTHSPSTRIGFSNLLSENLTDKNEEANENDIKKEENSNRDLKTPLPELQFNLDSISSSDGESSAIKDLFKKMKKKNLERQKLLSQVFEVSSSDSELAEGSRKGRRNIRDILDDDVLDRDTQIANEEEKERLERLTQRNISFSQTPDDKVDDSNDFILDYDLETKKPLVKVHENLNKYLKAHQREGIQFMWDSCYESVEMIKKKNYKGQGCILAHCMGLGKTLQVIALAHTVMQNRLCATKTALVVCPRSVTLNWREEIAKWLRPFPMHHRTVYDFAETPGLNQRTKILKKWTQTGGFMLISYDMYRNLMKRVVDSKDKNKHFDMFNSTLRDPGPDIVFLDEGHALKNEKTIVRKQLEEIRTKRRIILTGTPMQNNLKEYFWMVHFVKPKLLGTFKEYSNRFANPILNGQHKDSKDRDIIIMKKRSHVLHKLLEGTVQRKEVTVLKEYLPQKHEFVLMLTPSPVQERLYNFFLTGFAQKIDLGVKFVSAKLFADFQALKRVWTHPYALVDFLEKSEEQKKKRLARAHTKSTTNFKKDISMDMDEIADDLNPDSQNIKEYLCKSEEPVVPWDWWKQAAKEEEINDIFSSSKLTVMFDIIQECALTKEKVLVFSSSLNVLNTIEYYLEIITNVTVSNYQGSHPKVGIYRGIWKHELDYFRFDGKLPSEERQLYCKKFNDTSNPRGRLFLVSTRAGGIGLNMTGANRVIILDVSWNPAIDTQSIFRAYRLQQKKTCYIYRLIAMGFMEQKIYERSVTKEAIACRVVDELQIDRHYSMAHLAELYALYQTPEPKSIPKIPEDSVLANLLPNSKHIYSYHEHDSLLMNLEEEELMPEEQKLAWEEFLREKDPVQNMMVPIGYVLKDGVMMPEHYANQLEATRQNNISANIEPIKSSIPSTSEPYGFAKEQEAGPQTNNSGNFQPRRVLPPIPSTKQHRPIKPSTLLQPININSKASADTPFIRETIDLTSQPSTSAGFRRDMPSLNSSNNRGHKKDYARPARTNKHLRYFDKSPYSRTPAYIQRIVVDSTNEIDLAAPTDIVDLTTELPNVVVPEKTPRARLEESPPETRSFFELPVVSNEIEIRSSNPVDPPATDISKIHSLTRDSTTKNMEVSRLKSNKEATETNDVISNLQTGVTLGSRSPKDKANEISNNEELAMHDYCQENTLSNIAIRNPESINKAYEQRINRGDVNSGNECSKMLPDNQSNNNIMKNDDIIVLNSMCMENAENSSSNKASSSSYASNKRKTSEKAVENNMSEKVNEVIHSRNEPQGKLKQAEKDNSTFTLSQQHEEMIEASLASYLRDEESRQRSKGGLELSD